MFFVITWKFELDEGQQQVLLISQQAADRNYDMGRVLTFVLTHIISIKW